MMNKPIKPAADWSRRRDVAAAVFPRKDTAAAFGGNDAATSVELITSIPVNAPQKLHLKLNCSKALFSNMKWGGTSASRDENGQMDV